MSADPSPPLAAQPPRAAERTAPPAGTAPRAQPGWADAALVLETGEVLWGRAVGARGEAVGELCFNTALTGYQEVLSDPSYAEQLITFTAPHIGNVGVNALDQEHPRPACRGAVMRERPTAASSYRAEGDLEAWMAARGLVGICEVDTRALTHRLRGGAPRAAVVSGAGALDVAGALERARAWRGLEGAELSLTVAEEKLGPWAGGLWSPPERPAPPPPAGPAPRVAVVDFGVKDNILRCLAGRGCEVVVVSPRVTLDALLALAPHAVCLSNGPGDPAATLEYAGPLLRGLLTDPRAAALPLLGICLGHQLLGLALGARTEKMRQGHRGANHPILNVERGTVEITSQNHGFMVVDLPAGVRETHRSLFDGSIAGLRVEGRPVRSVQYHPEASPGPHDSAYLFDELVADARALLRGEPAPAWAGARREGGGDARRRRVLIVGAGPIVIGQACEFDYSGAQACKALRAVGHEVVLVNSNPATIMTDPQMADRTYIEPLTVEYLREIIRVERPDALLPTMGGQTALNLSLELERQGVLARYGVELIGAKAEAIDTAEDRQKFRDAMDEIGLSSPRSRLVSSVAEALVAVERTGLPAVVRPSFTLGGSGGGIANTLEELKEIVAHGVRLSPVGQALVEESLLGWKEFELEVVRDRHDNGIIVCSIENVDPMGVHTGDSITVAPALTLTDKEYQRLRDGALACLRRVGVDTGGSNVQFAVHPRDGRAAVIEMNPRVSRSSALASKATGFPIAKVAARLAVGSTLGELQNELTRATPASFEPSIDYVVVKVPRFTFEKFSDDTPELGTSMKSVGEVMAMGRSFRAALQKALRGLEVGLTGLSEQPLPADPAAALALLRERRPMRLLLAAQALRAGLRVEEIAGASGFDPWFVRELEALVAAEEALRADPGLLSSAEGLWSYKRLGFSDARLAELTGRKEGEVRAARWARGVHPAYKRVDTCAAEFEAHANYLYSSYEGPPESCLGDPCEARPSARDKVIILGGGPNRIGQGIEFDYCCVHACYAVREAGCEAIMVNCNPETVSTDYDTADRLYFEPLTAEDVVEIARVEMARGRLRGVIVQLGGQTPLNLAAALDEAGIPILGTSRDVIDRAEDRGRFQELVEGLGLRQPASGVATSAEEAVAVARRVGYPVLLRPSYVLGGRAMRLVGSDEEARAYMAEAIAAGRGGVLVDKYLSNAIELDVDALCDGREVCVVGVMEHIEEAGVHSGDSACALPPYSLSEAQVEEVRAQTCALALALGVVGLMNVQFALYEGALYLIEVNPRASRTVPFVAKATGVEVAKVATRLMLGEPLSAQPLAARADGYTAVKEAVFPFARFPRSDMGLGPEMRSTGEVMGWDRSFALAYAKAQQAAGMALPRAGRALFTVPAPSERGRFAEVAEALAALGYEIAATPETEETWRAQGIDCEVRPYSEADAIAAIKAGEVHALVSVGSQSGEISPLRRAALAAGLPYFTRLTNARSLVRALRALHARGVPSVRALQG
ncbi:MAG: carbamoyl-phosphate synthase large subunit [Deltaproteobacteria bacterium]|nr:carbamoyl-phosphate synthase large subunit [Deltaproteobacteria bacterium]